MNFQYLNFDGNKYRLFGILRKYNLSMLAIISMILAWSFYAYHMILFAVFSLFFIYFLLCFFLDHFEIDRYKKNIYGRTGLLNKSYKIPFEQVVSFEYYTRFILIIPLYHKLNIVYEDNGQLKSVTAACSMIIEEKPLRVLEKEIVQIINPQNS